MTALLLLDLDGVCALETTLAGESVVEIFKLHEGLGEEIAALNFPVAVITHRSRKEALRILSAIGVNIGGIRGVFTAEDFLFASLGKPLDLFRRGLKKSAALPAIERKFGIDRARMAIIDDRDDVLQDLRSNGLGLCMQAPGQIAEPADGLVSFEFSEAVRVFMEWRQTGQVCPEIRRLTPLAVFAAHPRRTGKNTHASKLTVFSTVRRIARYARNLRRAPG